MMIVGEAWGKDEEIEGKPFVGASGRLLNQLLAQVGISRRDCYITNVFNLRPKPTNDVKNLCGTKAEGIPGWPALTAGKYVRAEYGVELSRLFDEIRREKPNVILALGATAVWALTRQTPKITQVRGSPFMSHLGVKVLPTYHPAALMREFSLRPVVWADMHKAKVEDGFPELKIPEREIWIEPTLADLDEFYSRFILPAPLVAADIETKQNQITCIGFAPSPGRSIVVPFWDQSQADGNYWRNINDELAAWAWVRKVLAEKPILFQNGLFDMQHLWFTYGIPSNAVEDTMLLHHAMQPELKKSLGFLASIYTEEPQWKFMHRSTKKEDTE